MQTQTQRLNEKREFPRYKSCIDKDVFVAVRPAFKKLGKLKDVSMNGLGFTYALMDAQEKLLSDNERSLHVDIFVSENGFYLPRLKCKLAYDKHCPNHSEFFVAMQLRRVGLKFDSDEITDEQKEKIQLFLKHYTAGEA